MKSLLHLPIKYETLIKKYFEKINEEINDIVDENNETLDDYNLYKMTNNIIIENENNTNNIYKYNNSKYQVTDTIIDYTFDDNDIKLNGVFISNIDTSKIKVNKTEIACWWCCHKFDNYPISIPYKYYQQNCLFKCRGIFCTFSCALAYISNKKMVHSIFLLKMLYKKMYPNAKETIRKSPPKEILKMFGGPLDIENYRMDNVLHNINIYPIIYMNEQLHIQSIYGNESSNINTNTSFLNETTIKKAKERLKNNKIEHQGLSIAEKLSKQNLQM
jgi:hypothetical protein